MITVTLLKGTGFSYYNNFYDILNYTTNLSDFLKSMTQKVQFVFNTSYDYEDNTYHSALFKRETRQKFKTKVLSKFAKITQLATYMKY